MRKNRGAGGLALQIIQERLAVILYQSGQASINAQPQKIQLTDLAPQGLGLPGLVPFANHGLE